MWVGIMLGLVLGIIAGCLVGMLVDENVSNNWLGPVIWVIVIIISMVSGGLVGMELHKSDYEAFCDSWDSQKSILEQSITKLDIDGKDKKQMTLQAIEFNKDLANWKSQATKFYYWYLDKRKIEELQYIEVWED